MKFRAFIGIVASIIGYFLRGDVLVGVICFCGDNLVCFNGDSYFYGEYWKGFAGDYFYKMTGENLFGF